MDSTSIIRAISGVFFLGFFALFIVIAIFYILTLSRALEKCHPASRTIQPGTLWLLLIPLVNLIWHFFVVLGMAKSLGNEFRARGIINVDPQPGQSFGLAMCICGACAIIPILGFLAALGHLVLWILYWSKMATYSRMLDQAPVVQGAPILPV